MNKTIVGLSAVLLALGAYAAETKVEKLAPDIWRVRVSRDGKWPESMLNRYGVIENLPVLETGDKMAFGFVEPSVRQTEKGFELRFPLAKDERIYGLGDVSRKCLERRGGSYDMWVKNVKSYIPIPMFMTSRGWGALVNQTRLHTFDVGKADPDALVVSAAEGEVDFYVFCGRDYRELLEAYTRLTGRPALLPAFAYGFAYVANQWADMFSINEEAYRFRDLDIPCDIMGLEPGWMEYHYDSTTKKAWSSARFSFPSWMTPRMHNGTWIDGLAHMGFKLSLWLCMNYDLFVFEDACAEGRETVAGSVGVQSREEVPASDVFFDERVNGKFPDRASAEKARLGSALNRIEALENKPVSRPDGLSGKRQDGKEAWFKHLTKFVDRGARCFKLDASEQAGEHKGRIWNGRYASAEVHNIYPVVYAKQMSQGYETYTGNRAMTYSSCGYVGLQRYVASWAGDTGGGKGSLVSIMNLGMSGHSNGSCDMGVGADAVHFGVFAPWSQQNNWDYFDQIWYHDKEVVETVRDYIRLRYRLFPYIYGTGAVSARTGWPLVRPLAFVYPDVKEYANEVGTYMFGDSLLVSAFSDDVKIPEGKWYEWRTCREEVGPKTVPAAKAANWGGALHVKAGAIIPMWPQKQHIDRGWNKVVELHVWPGADGRAELYEDDGVSLGYRTGASAATPLVYADGKLTVGKRKGSFRGMPAVRTMCVVWHTPKGTTRSPEQNVGNAGALFAGGQ